MKKEQVEELVESGIESLETALKAGKSDQLKKFLEVMAKFPRYSFCNTLLISNQFPTASMVQGYRAWQKMGRTVKKGQKGIGIFAPMIGKKKTEDENGDETTKRVCYGFRVVHVFDVSQTEGKELPEFTAVTGDPGDNLYAVESLIRSEGIDLSYQEIEGGALGVSKKGAIVISPELEPAKRIMTLVHELAHERLHGDERRKETTKTVRETEAEAVAYVVCQALGIDGLDHCSDYIQLYNGDTDTLADSLEYIQKTANSILNGIQDELKNVQAVAA